MSDFVAPLLQWLNANPEYAGIATFIISAGESVAIIGTIVPGSITMTAIGALAGAGIIPLWPTIFWAIMGAIVGDGISYWIGHYFKDRLPTIWPFRNYPGLLKNGEDFVRKYGYMSVFIGRFVGPVRALVPVVAGMFGMTPLKFTIANVLSAIGWAPAYMLPGILMGAASLELPPDIAIHVVLVFLLIGLFILLCLWFAYKIIQWIFYHTTNLQMNIWHWLTKNRYLSYVTKFFRHHNDAKTRSQVALGFYFLDVVVLFLLLVGLVKLSGASNLAMNDAIFHLFRGIRSPALDDVMVKITILGQKEVLFTSLVLLSGYLYFSNRKRAAAHLLALGVLAGGAVFVLKYIIHNIRPWGIYNSPETFSMPSGHVTLSTVVLFGFAFFLTRSGSRKKKIFFYTLATILTLAIAVSRLYLGAHWFTDVLSAWLLSAAILFVVIVSYRRRQEIPISTTKFGIATLACLAVTFGIYHHFKHDTMLVNYSQVDYPQTSIQMNDWWKHDGNLPAYRASLFGFPSQPINLQWLGDLPKIQDTLSKEGWTLPPARDFVSALHRIADVRSGEYLALISPQYLDKNPELTMVRRLDDNSLIVLRFWFANRSIENSQTPLWVGILGTIPRSYSWITNRHPGYLTVDPTLIFPLKTAISGWRWKVIDVPQLKYTQKMLLIREN